MTAPTPNLDTDATNASAGSALRTLSSYRNAIDMLMRSVSDGLGKSLKDSVELILASQGRLIVSGMGKSGHIGRKIAATFASTGTPAFFVHPSEASHGDLGMITHGDIVLAISWSGETAELRSLISYSRRFRIPLIAVTSGPDSALANAADIALLLPKVQEACPHNLAPTTSTMAQLALGDALAIALLESRGFTPTEFQVFHPGGKLGAMLKFVRDLMHGLDETPLVPAGTRLSTAIIEMSAKGYGCVGIVDEAGVLIGIITDGDLRRHIGQDLLNQQQNTFDVPVELVMTRNPKRIRSDQLASEALNVINSAKVQALMVVESRKPVGIIRLHDILRSGVV